MASDFLFDGFRRNLMAGAENNQILDAPYDPPISRTVHFALVAGAKPSIAKHFGCLLWPVPIAGKKIRPAHDNLIVVADPHFNAGNRRTDASGNDIVRIVHRTDSGRLRQSVNLQDGNAKHAEIVLGLGSERRRSADEGLQIFTYHLLADRGKDDLMGQP